MLRPPVALSVLNAFFGAIASPRSGMAIPESAGELEKVVSGYSETFS